MRFFCTLFLFLCLCFLLGEVNGDKKKKLLKAAEKGAKMVAVKKASNRFFTIWKIISIIVILGVLAVVGYYIFIFYPLVCAKRGKYDVMEMAHV